METLKILLVAIAPVTSFACMVLLFRSYVATRTRLLLWSAVCFVGQSVSNAALFVDIVVLPESDLRAMRLTAALIGMLFLIYGFIRETE
jgi:hypothetical protein